MTEDTDREQTEREDSEAEEQRGYRKVDRRRSRQAPDTEDAEADKPEPEAEEAAEPEAEQPVQPEPETDQQEPHPAEAQAAEQARAAEPETTEPHAAQPQQDVAEAAQGPAVEGEPQPEMMDWTEVGVYGVLRFATGLLMQLAWIALGLQAPPGGGETQQDLPQAKAAIDALPDLIEHLEPDLSEEEKRDLESTVANLRINYVQRSE